MGKKAPSNQHYILSIYSVSTGDRKIVHLAGEDNDGINGNIQAKHVFTISGKTFNKARVVVDDFWDVVGEDKAFINNDRDKKWSALQPDIIVKNALEKIGQEGYNLICSNCEHFANFCRYGLSKSDQMSRVFLVFTTQAVVDFTNVEAQQCLDQMLTKPKKSPSLVMP
uniref:LRAT domain-containing protein n=1 Tax=Biomphalaria glabrata TaxID=6526 RepID=A0A2C9M2R2_BIOGL